ncbi:hypothetical protein EDD18DRAFT_1308436 [Armillaria luteobubalina]|uniref:CxC1-like cysteine cluster associated with KDZ transposases domain-containing protein n=1 Tax=Armillaria luteobubalina TaxID=153913 RepID=A0AA39UVE4_9AGAR|nr:hypothetical protein EDD18DRAFT_1308436 [Armillaria luteobubalina]
MDIFHAITLRCPQMSVQGFVRTLCDLHHSPIAGSIREQFSICYDVYIAILEGVEHQIMKKLGREDVDWHLKNCCSACTFELEGEEKMEFSMFGAMDGNDSLKRVPHSKLVESLDGGRVSIEREDSRDGGGSYILSRNTVDLWSKEAIGEVDAPPPDGVTPCEERWKNMSDDRTSKMWNVFDETGFFLSLCCHGSVLLGADMVRSGEQAKYPLAVVSKLLETFGERLGLGYDIGCKFGGTVNQSPLGELARHKKLRVLVGLFHGHAHNRLCQLRHLGTYLTGLGLEDLETLERFFSKLNALAGVIRYASQFHRRQRITWYLKHIDCSESFEHLSSFLCNNYRQALEIVETYPALQKSMRELGVEDENEFNLWLKEEEVYLSGLQREPPEETVEMEYFSRLLTIAQGQDDTRKMETARRRLLEKWSQELERLQDLEQSLNISPDERWTIGCAKWIENEQRVAMRTYRQRLDRLESLVVSRIFELTKMNMSHTGYKMRKHIGKALQARSKAIRTALAQYNTAAAALKPPRPPLQWERVIEYAFLSDFDLLRDVRRDMSGHKWATPAGRKAMDTYFKICRAREEIKRLNIEIRRVVTYMHVEDAYLQRCEKSIAMTTPALALQVSHYRHGRERFYAMHMRRFYTLSEDPHFTGDISVGSVAGVREGFGLDTPEDVTMDVEDSLHNATMATDSLDHDMVDLGNDSQSDGSDDEDEGNTIDEEVEAIMLISGDNAQE